MGTHVRKVAAQPQTGWCTEQVASSPGLQGWRLKMAAIWLIS